MSQQIAQATLALAVLHAAARQNAPLQTRHVMYNAAMSTLRPLPLSAILEAHRKLTGNK